MSATILNGRTLSEQWLTDLSVQVQALHEPLHLAAVCVTGAGDLEAFVRLKQKAAQSIGVTFSAYFFDEQDEAGAIATLSFLANDGSVHGVFVELPVPELWDRAALLSLVPPGKDVDALTRAPRVPEPAVRALEYALQSGGIPVRGARACVVGQGALVGKPVSRWLAARGAEVSVIDDATVDPQLVCAQADIVVTGAGVPELVTGEWVKDGAAVFDFGYAEQNGRYVGDVDAPSVEKKAGLMTPVPGGMGPLVVAAVLENLLALATV